MITRIVQTSSIARNFIWTYLKQSSWKYPPRACTQFFKSTLFAQARQIAEATTDEVTDIWIISKKTFDIVKLFSKSTSLCMHLTTTIEPQSPHLHADYLIRVNSVSTGLFRSAHQRSSKRSHCSQFPSGLTGVPKCPTP